METITDTLDHSVLVVDDEPQVVWVLQYSLEAEGYTTLSARDGAAALEAVDLFHPKLMLLDIMMPTLDGWSVLEGIGKLPDGKRPRVVVVSALSSLRDRARAAELGADAVVFSTSITHTEQRVAYQPAYNPWGYYAPYYGPGPYGYWGPWGYRYGLWGPMWGYQQAVPVPYSVRTTTVKGTAIHYS